MLIEGEVTDGINTVPVLSVWEHNPNDPLVVSVDFVDHAVWKFSVDLVWEALASPHEGLHGFGDVKIEVTGEDLLLYLSNGVVSCTVKFPTGEVQDFMDQVDDGDSEEVISRELDEFLSAL